MSTGASPCLLVLEDSDEDFDTVLDAARDGGFPHEIRRAVTGEECLRLLESWEEERRPLPSLVVLDLNTPGGDGRDALRSIRGNERLRRMPLVILSTSSNPRDLEFCYDSGANAYHTKPVDYLDHLAVIRQILSYWMKWVVLPAA